MLLLCSFESSELPESLDSFVEVEFDDLLEDFVVPDVSDETDESCDILSSSVVFGDEL